MERIVDRTVEALRAGGTILYPTDTIWGVGCDASNGDAVERLYDIKRRDRTKSMLVLVSLEMLDGALMRSAGRLEGLLTSERPTTVILPEAMWRGLLKVGVADNLQAADGSLGLRVPRHRFCQGVMGRLGRPLVSTSANLSGHPSPRSYAEIEDELRRRVDFRVPPLEEFLSDETRGSTIVKLLENGETVVIRP